jgi:3-oxoacyl-[acyl-carrier protein] reductase
MRLPVKHKQHTRHVVITGASGGLGSACAAAFAAPGTVLGLHYAHNIAAIQALAEKCTCSNAIPYLIESDFSMPGAAASAAMIIEQAHAQLDVLILNAGITVNALLVHAAETDWDTLFTVNYRSQVQLISRLAETCLGTGSHVIVTGSLAGLRGQKGSSAYAASKAALVGYVSDAAQRYGSNGICVNAILPGWLKTAITETMTEKQFARAVSENVLGRGATCEEIAAFTTYLAGTKHISGQLFCLDSRGDFRF